MKLIKNTLVISTILLVLLLSLGSLQATDMVDTNDNIVLDDTNTELIANQDNINVNGDDQYIDSLETPVKEEKSNAMQKSSNELKLFDLQYKIDNATENTIYLTDDYKYDGAYSDQGQGITINKDIKIVGNGHYLDGDGYGRGLKIGTGYIVEIENMTFKNCMSEDNGGAIYLGPTSDLTVRYCVFENNEAYNANGAAVYGNEYSTIEIYNSTFKDNRAIRNSSLDWNDFKKGMASTVIVNRGSNLNIYGSEFLNNDAYIGTVLAISYNDQEYALSTLLIKDCLFEGNTAKNNGIIYLDEYGKGQFLNSVFKNNKATEKGCLLMLEASPYSLVKNCRFEGNYAPNGVIDLGMFGKNKTTADIINCNFTNNKANSGASIYSTSGILKVSGCRFTSNTATKSGAGITNYKGSLKVYNSVFSKNRADYGPAIYCIAGDSLIGNCNFSYNNATKSGGAVGVDSKGTLKVYNSKFYSNRGLYGGAIYSISANLLVSNTTFTSNVASKSGGAIGTTTAGTLKIYNSKFYSNRGTYGGAIYSQLKDVVSSKNTFSKNKVTKTGADVYGIVYAKIYKISSKGGKVKLKVQLSSRWGNLLKQQFRITVKGAKKTYYTNVLKTNAKGQVSGFVNKKMARGTYTASIIIRGVDLKLTKLTFKV